MDKVTNTPKKGPEAESRPVEALRDQPVFIPATDVVEKQDEITVVCDMPGVDERNLEVSLENGELTLVGRQDAVEPEQHELLHREYRSGVFQRSFTINEDIDTERVSAKLAGGVLKVTLPKAARAQSKKIAVQVES